jgi:hypothetical protein
MEKKRLINFINKYNLGGLCNQVKISLKDGQMNTTFATDQKDLLGWVQTDVPELEKFNIEFGVFNTSTLSKVVSVLQSDIDVSFQTDYGKVVSMQVSDDIFEGNVMLADLDIIENPPTVNELPASDVKLSITPTFIEQFIKAKNALSESEFLAFVQDGDSIKLVINYAEFNSDSIKLEVPIVESVQQIPVMRFNANLIKEIFIANKDCTNAVMTLSSQGLMNVKFLGDGYRTSYLVVMFQG